MSASAIAFVTLAAFLAGAAGQDAASLLQKPDFAVSSPPGENQPAEREPYVIGLRRESVPIYRRGKIASFKTSYSGVLRVGSPAQEFRVVFDTGSGNIVLPAVECQSEACLVEDRRRYNLSASETGVAVNADGSIVPEGEYSEQVTIGFGTGEITGEYARDTVCFGAPASVEAEAVTGEVSSEAPVEVPAGDDTAPVTVGEVEGENLVVVSDSTEPAVASSELCVEMSVILAVEMSTQPFKTFRFDGILGLGLDGLAMSKNFSAFEMLMGTGLGQSHFGVFLTEGEDDEVSEIAFGGHDHRRILEPLSWAPVAMPELGYWQVQIVAVRINGVTLDVCKDGTCRGVVDTGTSHLGIPAPADAEVAELLTSEAGDLLDCRLADAPEMEIELEGYNITLHPFNYMRRLPLREGVSVSSPQGVHVPSAETNATLTAPSSADPVGQQPAATPPATTEGSPPAANEASPATPPTQADQVSTGTAPEASTTAAAAAAAAAAAGTGAPAAESAAPAPMAGSAIATTGGSELQTQAQAEAEEVVRRFCRPRLMPVRLPEPLGPKLFILGEPVLHRYYTVYDSANHQVGFSLANNRRNTMDPAEVTDRRGALPKEVDMLLMQKRMTVTREGGKRGEIQEESMLVQVKLRLSVRQRRK